MASPASPAAAAPWRKLFQDHLSKMTSREMALATIARDPQGQWVPRVRYVGFRAFWGQPELHPEAEKQLKEEDELNPLIFESDMLTFTTDVRMEKTGQLVGSGGVVETVFWAKEAKNQWRIKGRAFVIGASAEEGGELEAREEIKKGMRLRDAGGTAVGGEWSWEKEITTYFANHTPVMRGSFRNPPPGHPVTEVPSDPNIKLGQKVHDLHDPTARKNFRVVVIRPEEVERLDLNDYENPRRFQWKSIGDDGEQGQRWVETELWP
ncbi:hypothetical protein DTO282E5_8612 [Paecilomyces variotii]|nr:hypothetical protein DTO282E5_8612 [Paecilomyces variotii]